MTGYYGLTVNNQLIKYYQTRKLCILNIETRAVNSITHAFPHRDNYLRSIIALRAEWGFAKTDKKRASRSLRSPQSGQLMTGQTACKYRTRSPANLRPPDCENRAFCPRIFRVWAVQFRRVEELSFVRMFQHDVAVFTVDIV